MTAKGYFQFIDGTADLWDWVAAGLDCALRAVKSNKVSATNE